MIYNFSERLDLRFPELRLRLFIYFFIVPLALFMEHEQCI